MRSLALDQARRVCRWIVPAERALGEEAHGQGAGDAYDAYDKEMAMRSPLRTDAAGGGLESSGLPQPDEDWERERNAGLCHCVIVRLQPRGRRTAKGHLYSPSTTPDVDIHTSLIGYFYTVFFITLEF